MSFEFSDAMRTSCPALDASSRRRSRNARHNAGVLTSSQARSNRSLEFGRRSRAVRTWALSCVESF